MGYNRCGNGPRREGRFYGGNGVDAIYPGRNHMISGYSGHVPGEQFQFGRTWEITTYNPMRKGTPWPVNKKDEPAPNYTTDLNSYKCAEDLGEYSGPTVSNDQGGSLYPQPGSAIVQNYENTIRPVADACLNVSGRWDGENFKVHDTDVARTYEPHPPQNHTHGASQRVSCRCRPFSAPTWTGQCRNDQAGLVADSVRHPLDTYAMQLRRSTQGCQAPPEIPTYSDFGVQTTFSPRPPSAPRQSDHDPARVYRSYSAKNNANFEKIRFGQDGRMRTTTWPSALYRQRESMKSGYGGHVPREQFQFGKNWEITTFNPLRITT